MKMVSWLAWFGLVLILFSFVGFNLTYSPVWLFTKYRRLRPYILAQMKVESANQTSSLANRGFNYFGMRVATQRPNVQFGVSNSYATYLFPVFSLVDFLMWLDYTKFPVRVDSAEAYVYALVDRSYFTANPAIYLKAIKSQL